MTAALVAIIFIAAQVLLWIAMAALLALILAPPVDRIETRLRCRRAIAVVLVMMTAAIGVSAVAFVIVRPVVTQWTTISTKVPDLLDEARAGRGPAGALVKRLKLDERLSETNLKKLGKNISSSSFNFARRIGNAIGALITILSLAVLMLVEGPRIVNGVITMLRPKHATRIKDVGRQCAKAVSGYMAGNLVISAIAGTMSYTFLAIAGVPFAGVLAIWVAFTDLIPLVGAVIGATVTILVAFFESSNAGIAAFIFFVVYQLFENYVLQVTIMSKAVRLDPLSVLLSMLIGVELLGFIGAFVAIPIAGMLQVVVRDLWNHSSLTQQRATALATGAPESDTSVT